MNEMKVRTAYGDLFGLELVAECLEEEYRQKAVGIPEGEKRDELLAKADIQYHKKLAYEQARQVMSKAIYPNRNRDWRIRKREKSVTLNIHTKNPNRIIAEAFSSTIRHTFDKMLPYSFRVRRNGDIVFLFDPNSLSTDMTDKPKLVVKFKKNLEDIMTWVILHRILQLIDPDTWYGGQELKYNTVYYTT